MLSDARLLGDSVIFQMQGHLLSAEGGVNISKPEHTICYLPSAQCQRECCSQLLQYHLTGGEAVLL